MAKRDEPLHGSASMTHQADRGRRIAGRGRVEQAGWLRAEWVNRGGRRARVYELTRAGRKQRAAAESQRHAATAAVNRVLTMA
jgi:PadR family transcriptional regulator PadR